MGSAEEEWQLFDYLLQVGREVSLGDPETIAMRKAELLEQITRIDSSRLGAVESIRMTLEMIEVALKSPGD